jgi:phage terminase large subunit
MGQTIVIPFAPRKYQQPLADAICDGRYKRAFVLWHRRAGKDILLWNMIIREALQKKALYYYLLPTYAQARKIIWDGITNDGMRFINYVPREAIEGTNGQEMKITLKNGSIIQLIGTDRFDGIRGTNPQGVVFSEFAYQNPIVWEIVRPILTVNNGWAVFNTTPNGKNHAYDMYNMALASDDWFCERLSILDTDVLTAEDMEKERAEGMSEEMIAQEYYCSFDVGTLGSYYAKYVADMQKENRICAVPYEKNVVVDLFLDLGRNDSTSIIFAQTVGKEIRIIDFYEHYGEDVAHYCRELRSRDYDYGTMYLPHDAFNKRMESMKTIAEQFKEAGFNVKRVPNASINNGIQAVRKMFPRFWIDKTRGCDLIRALENYHKEWDEKAKVFRNNPKHDWSSHSCDAMRYLAIGLKEDSPDYNYDQAVQAYTSHRTGIPKVKEGLGVKWDEYKEYQRAVKEYMG